MKRKFDFASLAGLLTWVLVYSVSLYVLAKVAPTQATAAVHALFIGYGAAFWLLTREQGLCSLRGRFGLLLLVLQLGCAFALIWLLPVRYFDFLSILTVIWVAMLPFVVPTAVAILLSVLVVAAWFSLIAWQSGTSVWISALLYGSFHIFAVLVQSASRDAEKARDELEQKHQQLQATQQLLQAASRQSERTRIARNLHDLVGHHLTALTIQLQVAGHLSSGDAKAQIDKCHQLAKLLLADVREAVSTMRQYADVALLDAIKPLVTLLPEQLNIRLQIPADIMLNDLHQAQHLLCIVQEAISNSLKHSGASEMQIMANVSDGTLQVTIVDNGKLSANWLPGNGIRGMQERLTECGGNLVITPAHGALQLSICLPYQESDNA